MLDNYLDLPDDEFIKFTEEVIKYHSPNGEDINLPLLDSIKAAEIDKALKLKGSNPPNEVAPKLFPVTVIPDPNI